MNAKTAQQNIASSLNILTKTMITAILSEGIGKKTRWKKLQLLLLSFMTFVIKIIRRSLLKIRGKSKDF